MGDNDRLILGALEYCLKFKPDAKYDIGHENKWNDLFSVPYPGYGNEFWFDGYSMTPEILGNYLYGLAGRYLGFNSVTIHQGAGIAKRYKNSDRFSYINKPEELYGDDPDDYYWIEKALEGYNNPKFYDFSLTDVDHLDFLFKNFIENRK